MQSLRIHLLQSSLVKLHALVKSLSMINAAFLAVVVVAVLAACIITAPLMQDALVSKDQFTAQVIFWVQVEQTVPVRSRLGTCCINYWRFNFFVKSVSFRAYANFDTGIPGAGPRMRRVPVEPLQ